MPITQTRLKTMVDAAAEYKDKLNQLKRMIQQSYNRALANKLPAIEALEELAQNQYGIDTHQFDSLLAREQVKHELTVEKNNYIRGLKRRQRDGTQFYTREGPVAPIRQPHSSPDALAAAARASDEGELPIEQLTDELNSMASGEDARRGNGEDANPGARARLADATPSDPTLQDFDAAMAVADPFVAERTRRAIADEATRQAALARLAADTSKEANSDTK